MDFGPFRTRSSGQAVSTTTGIRLTRGELIAVAGEVAGLAIVGFAGL
jgi:hypothetical protein